EQRVWGPHTIEPAPDGLDRNGALVSDLKQEPSGKVDPVRQPAMRDERAERDQDAQDGQGVVPAPLADEVVVGVCEDLDHRTLPLVNGGTRGEAGRPRARGRSGRGGAAPERSCGKAPGPQPSAEGVSDRRGGRQADRPATWVAEPAGDTIGGSEPHLGRPSAPPGSSPPGGGRVE